MNINKFESEFSGLTINIADYYNISMRDWSSGKERRCEFISHQALINIKPLLAFDEHIQQVVFSGTDCLVGEADYLSLYEVFLKYYDMSGVPNLNQFIQHMTVLSKRNKVNSLKTRLNTLSRADNKLSDDWVKVALSCLNVANTAPNRERLRAFMFFALYRASGIESPIGHFQLTIKGRQGSGKSSAVKALFNADELSSMGSMNANIHALIGRWFVEDSEGGFRLAVKPNTYKKIVSDSSFQLNVKYKVQLQPVRLSHCIIETTNNSNLIKDLTGARRTLILEQLDSTPSRTLTEIAELSESILAAAHNDWLLSTSWKPSLEKLYENHLFYSTLTVFNDALRTLIERLGYQRTNGKEQPRKGRYGYRLFVTDLGSITAISVLAEYGISRKQFEFYLGRYKRFSVYQSKYSVGWWIDLGIAENKPFDKP